jgi:hypothetical protein
MNTQIFVMLHQVRKDAPENIHVNLDSSTPRWNDQLKGPA